MVFCMNIRVMIVEDEPPILRAVKKMIQGCDDEFTVCHTAKNGADAMDYLRGASVDVLFTDIRMPLVDGLVLMEYVHADHPNIIIVVLSGYQDFEYTKSAIMNNAFDYLLKPITAETMSQMLSKLKTEYYRRSRAEKTAGLLANIHQMAHAGINGIENAEKYLVMTMCAGPAPPFDYEDILPPGASFWREHAPPFIDEVTDWFFAGKTPAEKILIRELASANQIEETAKSVFSAVADKAVEMPLTILYFSRRLSFLDVGAAIRALQRNLPGKQQVGVSLLLSIDSFATPPKEAYNPAFEPDDPPGEEADSLIDALITGDMELIGHCLASCLNTLDENESSYITIYEFFDRVISRLEKVKVLPRDFRVNVYGTVYRALSYDGLKRDLLDLFGNLQKSGYIQKTPGFVAGLKKYLEELYRKPITGADISRQFGFVPSYISRIFRQNFGYSPAQYITLLRIDEAKRLMREQPDMLIKEVAMLVGFKDQNHFSKAFKKETGVWPTAYRS